MIEIIFRGKRKDNGEWIYGDLIQWKSKGICAITPQEGDQWSNPYDFEVIPETLGRYTGLRTFDSDKPIFEGDVCKRILDKQNRYKKNEELFDYWLIEWLESTCGFTTTRITSNSKGLLLPKSQLRRNSYSQRFCEMDEIIGNIHDNPELLNQ